MRTAGETEFSTSAEIRPGRQSQFHNLAAGGCAQSLFRLAPQTIWSSTAFQNSGSLIAAGTGSLSSSVFTSIVTARDSGPPGTSFPGRKSGTTREYRGESSAHSHSAPTLDSQLAQLRVWLVRGAVEQ